MTQTYLPDKNKFKTYVDKIYESGWITNNGALVNELKYNLEQYLGVKNLLLVSNGTLALQVAYKLLELKGEVITTPFSFVATTSSLVWEGLKPVFVDIDKDTFCINPKAIEEKIVEETSAIVPVHVFGNGCEVEEIEKVAKKYDLKIIYDAAHAFGIKYKDRSILNYGDVSVLSFHATKLFHTIEGGALIINDDDLYEKAQRMINFGITGPETIKGLGINAKMNEFQAAMGLCVLEDMEDIIAERESAYDYYLETFQSNDYLTLPSHNPHCNYNYSYFPVLLKNEEILNKVMLNLEKNGIYPRRYFYPSLDTIEYVESEYAEISNDISKRILCLPMSTNIKKEDIEKIKTSFLNILL
ncbi:DegT/DnrJ/EryC1/StrS family aminotransferase [Paenibacillus dokdonensis]|uniref:DegT/DnrJ/EryC1/StrS family aminotransferase n=1 Tax=Paenibacillus dokdonensis TaxID=2567944 RepID=UPI001FE830C4|nr:DegT/DnrJ/EryC1/StrS family aminotransferase [Paenibacillus dokdonensis]